MGGFYSLIRIIICILIFLIFKKVKKNKEFNFRRLYYILLLFLIILHFINVEYYLLNFNSPKTAFYYSKFFKKISFIVEGENTALVVPEFGLMDIVIKDKNKWKIRKNVYSLRSYNFGHDQIPFSTYYYDGDHYVKFIIKNNENNIISDNRGTHFYMNKRGNNYTYYGYIKDFNEDYLLDINGSKYSIYFANEKIIDWNEVKKKWNELKE